jgi:FtsP/CotA-like multicopper oxidase with cupredoxin domain
MLTRFAFCLFLLPWIASAEVKHFDLTIRNQPVNMSGKKEVNFSLTVNGGIPAPTLEFTEGDTAEIVVHNDLKNPHEDVSLHWHGLLLPPLEDGVPFVNTPPIYPGESRTFRFPLRQSGTYWYHSHSMLQEQKGVYGAIVVHPKKQTIKADKDAVILLSDWSDENADQIMRNLKKDGDYYLFKKGTMRSYFEAMAQGKLGNQLANESTRMGGMDFSDVGYDAFLINGKRGSQLAVAKPGEKIRLRIINAASSTYFHVSLGNLPLTVIAADGNDISPVRAKEILLGMAETYDVLFTVPEEKNYEFRATAQDGTGQASTYIGKGEIVPAQDVPKPDLYAAMDHSNMQHGGHSMHHSDHKMPMHEGHGMHDGHGAHTPEPVLETLGVDQLKALEPMNFPKDAKVQELKLVLNGDMRRYVWHINGKVISQDRLLTINPGEIVRITYVNESMMHHPMHLHGHFFRVLTEKGEYSPWKHTVDVPPMGSRTIEFLADEVGQWMLHCHNLYHMDTGMARVVRYSNFKPSKEMAHQEHRDHHLMDPWNSYGKIEVSSNHMEGNLRLSQSWNEVSGRIEGANIEGKNFHYDFKNQWDYEADLFYRRWLGNWTNLILGGTSYGNRFQGVVGIGHFLPMMIETNFLMNHRGQFRLDVERKFQWTKTIYSNLDFTWRPGNQGGEHRTEFELSLMYSPVWAWAAGLMWTNDSLGAGVEYQF